MNSDTKMRFTSFKWLGAFLSAFLFLSLSSCVDLDYDQPPAGGDDPNLATNITIAELKSRHSLDQYEEITDDVTFDALVVSNDEAGNFYKQLVVQDETGGIEMRVDISDLHNLYPVGRKVYVKAKGLWLGDYNGLIQLGAGVGTSTSGDPELTRIPEILASKFIVPATYGNAVIPKLLTLDQITDADVSTLIRLDGVQFVTSDAGVTYADAVLQQTLNREIEDCGHRLLIVRNSGFAKFAADTTPTQNGTIIGVLGVFGSDYQLMIRDLEDVQMHGDRCGTGPTTPYTIAQIKDLFNLGTTVAPNGSLTGTVISDYTSGSVTGKNLYLQDATGGLVVRFTDNHNFALGDQVTINITGGSLELFSGLFQVNNVDPGTVVVNGHPGDVTPRLTTVVEALNNAAAWESTLIKIDSVTLTENTVFNGAVVVTDQTGAMTLFTRSAAVFATEALPAGKVSITAILNIHDAPELLIRTRQDVKGGGSTGGGEDINESFDAIANDADVIIPGWANIAVKGTRLWRGKVFSGNHYAQATSFNDAAAEMESWLITPPIVLDVPKKLTFESAYAFYVQSGLTVWISSNFNGTDVSGATWTQLTPVIAQQSDTENAFIPSGIIDLSGFTGPVRVGFKYIGSGPNGETTTFRIDNVKVEKI